MQIHATDLGTLVISQPSTELPPIRISLNVAVGGSLPAGGTVHQILRKSSSAPYDVEWSNDQDAQWGQVTGTITAQADLMALLAAKQSVSGMSNYLTLSQALAGYYPLNNPAGYITASAVDIFLTPSEASAIYQTQANMVSYITDAEAAIKLAPICYPRYGNPENYATESWVTGRGYITASALSGYATESWVNGLGYLTSGSLSGYATLSSPTFSGSVYVPALRNLLNTDLVIDSYNDNAAGTHYLHKFTPFDGKFVLAPNGGGLTFPDGTTQVTSAVSFDPTGYAQLSGATFTGKVVTTQTASTAPLNIGFLASIPTTTVAGDMWIGDNLNFKDKNGTSKLVANANTQNTFSQPQVIAPPSTATLPALRITNTAAVNSFVVEDEANPDSTPFIIGPDGRVGIHGTPASNAIHKLAIYNGNAVFSSGYGIAFGDGTIQTTAATTFNPAGYAQLSGATFTGKVNLTSAVNAASLNLDAGIIPTTTVAGDMWIADNLNFKNSTGTLRTIANLNTENTFDKPQVISTGTSATTAALRITNQSLTADSLIVEDTTNPDATAFVINNQGKVGIGVAPDANAALKIDSNGMSFNGLIVKPTSVANSPFTNGQMAHSEYPKELRITINGVQYAIPMRAV